MRPRLLDLFCGAGGAAMGYNRAGFDVVGVDIEPQTNYPFEFVQADISAWTPHGPWIRGLDLEHDFDAIHASPPCQAYTSMNNRHGSGSPQLIKMTRTLLQSSGLPYVIENVPGARQDLIDPYRLTGEMFGLAVHRPRLFETNWFMLSLYPPPRQRDAQAVYGKLDGRRLWTRKDGSTLKASSSLEVAAAAMGIDWMSWDELREAIPPAYTEFVGVQLLEHVQVPA